MYEYIKNYMGMDPYDYFCGMPAEESIDPYEEDNRKARDETFTENDDPLF